MKVSMKEHEKLEKKETPAFEVKEHSKGFLKKAAKMAEKPKATIAGTTVSGDVITWGCVAY